MDPVPISREQLASPSWTPGRRDFAGLIGLLGDEDKKVHALVEKALLRAGAAGLMALQALFDDARPPLRGRTVRAAARYAEGEGRSKALRDWFVARGSDEDARTRRAAFVALGRFDGEPVEQALLAAWEREADPSARRALVEALGKVGAVRARDVLSSVRASAHLDPELRRLLDEALVRLRRGTSHGSSDGSGGSSSGPVASRLDVDAVLPGRGPVRLHCRVGLEEILADECPRAWQARPAAAGVVEIDFRGALSELGRLRTALSAGFVIAVDPAAVKRDAVAGLAAALTSPDAARLLEALTRGQVRFRLEVAGGRQRALLLRLVEAVTARRPSWINDPSDRDWEFSVVEGFERGQPTASHVELSPRIPETRFPWRLADVPAASHPTLAAALARVSGTDPRDVVWDPFCGSGSELVERALLGPYACLQGSDLEESALAAARQNLQAAGLRDCVLARGDALGPPPVDGVTLIVTNPPMGRRVHRRADLGDFLDRFVQHAAAVLRPGGRLVWISPHPERNLEAAARAGLRVELRRSVDMGGFRGELQRLRKG